MQRSALGRWTIVVILGACSGSEAENPARTSPVAGGSAPPQAGSSAAGSGSLSSSNTATRAGSGGSSSTPPIVPVNPPTKPPAAGSGGAGAGTGAPPVAGTMAPPNPPTAGTDAAGAPAPVDATEPKIPEPKSECQPFKTGDMTFAGSRVKIWAGAKKDTKTGPMIIYWYATGGSVAEVNQGIPQQSITEITGAGGIIAAMYTTTRKGMNTGDNVWYTGDFDVTDEVIACAAKIHNIDTHHIHALGWSAGGLQSGYMAYARSNYMASVAPYSGGSLNMTFQDPSNVPAAMLFHGAPGVDQVIIDFSQSSMRMGTDIKMKGGYALDCNHGGAHMIPGPPGPAAAQLFFKAHAYKTKPSPWATMIPAGVPTYCKPY